MYNYQSLQTRETIMKVNTGGFSTRCKTLITFRKRKSRLDFAVHLKNPDQLWNTIFETEQNQINLYLNDGNGEGQHPKHGYVWLPTDRCHRCYWLCDCWLKLFFFQLFSLGDHHIWSVYLFWHSLCLMPFLAQSSHFYSGLEQAQWVHCLATFQVG